MTYRSLDRISSFLEARFETWRGGYEQGKNQMGLTEMGGGYCRCILLMTKGHDGVSVAVARLK